MVGLPGSGKSHFAEDEIYHFANKYHNLKVFSSDEYRKKLLGDEKNQNNNKLVFDTLYKDLRDWVAQGNDAIMDATNINIKSRKRIFDTLKDFECYYNAVVVAPPVECVIEQNIYRDRTVPVCAIYRMISQFQFPQKFEGFDEIQIVNSGGTFDVGTSNIRASIPLGTIIKQMFEFDQRNIHHSYTLGEHCEKLASFYKVHSPMWWAGLLHDVGKMYTQKIDDEGQAHYYGHEGYSAYWLASHPTVLPLTWQSIYQVIFVVNNHMHIRDILKSDKAIDKYSKLWGKDNFQLVVDFMNNDNGASGRIMNEECEK